MAYQEYRNIPTQGQHGAYEQNDPRYAQPSATSTAQASYTMPDGMGYKTREDSNAQQANESVRLSQARQPINEAVSSAVEITDTNNVISPELISQITANVIQQLKAANIPTTPTTGSMPPPPAPTSVVADNSSSTAGSPPMERTKVYTPPSPHRAAEETAPTQDSPTWQARSGQPAYGRGTPPLGRRPMSPFSQSSQVDDNDVKEERVSRPRAPMRVSTEGGATIVEKVWGTLFNDQGQTTPRLGQFLRGIAVHLIEDYEPKHSLVVTPSKLQKYYQDTKVTNEIYPWQVIFDDRTSSISRLFREMGAQHHLVQEHLDDRPDIPGLTPQGYETWATVLLRAHPDQEFERLAKTALDMPISNPDDKKERFPKELSRRLFPGEADNVVTAKLQKALKKHCNVKFPSRNNSTADPDARPQTSFRADEPLPTSPVKPVPVNRQVDPQEQPITPVSTRSSPPPNFERERQPYSKPPSEVSFEDSEDLPTPQPIERERKPYAAQPGGGKHYDNFDKPQPVPEYKQPTEPKLARSGSMAGNGRPTDLPKPRPNPIAIHQKPPPPPMDASETRRQRSNSTYNQDQQSRLNRNRSPSLNKGGDYARRSENDMMYGSTYPSNPSHDANEDARRYREFERDRERLANDRYDPARMAAYDPRERERDSRPKASVGQDARPYYTDEDYYRATGNAYPPPRDAYGQYPPTAYRDGR